MSKKFKTNVSDTNKDFSVTEILRDRHDIETTPGHKCSCPKCERETFSAAKDDKSGRCWHPSCGFIISKKLEANPIFRETQLTLFEIEKKSKAALQSEGGRVPLEYLQVARRVHPLVINALPVGAVPVDLNINKLFSKTIDEFNKAIRNAKGQDKIDQLEKDLAEFESKIQNLQERLSENPNYLIFIFKNAAGEICQLRFRGPHTKAFTSWKVGSEAGLFGAETGSSHLTEDKNIVVVEGEFNLLSLQSVLIRRCEKLGIETNFVFAAAIGSSSNPDFKNQIGRAHV